MIAVVGEIDRKGRVDRKKTQTTNLYKIHYHHPRNNPAVSETVTAEIVDKSKSCRHGNRDPAVLKTVTVTGSNRKVKTKGTDAAVAVDQALSLKEGLIAAAAERGSALPKDFEVDLSLKGVCVNSDPTELESLTAETNTSKDAKQILKRKAPKLSTAQSDRKSKSTDSAKKPTPKKAKPFGRALPRSTAATATKTTNRSKKSTKKKKKTGGEFTGTPTALAHLTDWKTKYSPTVGTEENDEADLAEKETHTQEIKS